MQVNNAKITGSIVDKDVLAASVLGMDEESANVVVDWSKIATDTYELAEECLKTNYSGAKGMIEALLPILQLSNSPRIVNVSSSFGHLKEIPSEWAKEVLGNAEILTEERVDEVLNEYLKDFKEGSLETKDINHNPGYLTTNEGAERVVKLALLPNDGPSGLFFSQNELTNFD
nr:(+)-neomenthol dehydrogenase [Quercus suber]